ncbi:V-type ATP synthase subunit I [Pseudoflavonifractor phocaeensis]|uniref:V-type ATP synthase subunit I n=1 Tax=Pseudoflavonifractor phocaeensis TaxID=1870988 RepID=UPI00195A52D7|nr:V-type ATPase 116kDa subunit family protein [Pseudoflavonifractor phocaeensis]MBM6723378.1 ATPase V [Pseudoflavonifractor phocaeensis]
MSVVPMKLLTLAGPLERFDQVVSACVIDQQFHPEPALRLMGEVKGVMPMDNSNPYAPLLRRAEEVAREAGVELAYAPFPDRLPRKELTAYFDQVEEQVMTLLRRKEELEHTAAESAAAVEQLEYLRGIGADLDELWGLEFSRFRYGYLPRETYDSFQDALDQEDDLLFVPTTLGPRRVYGVYFTTKQAKSRVDMLFSSLHFTRINLEVQPHGTVEQAIAELNAGVERMKGEAAQAEGELRALREQEQGRLLSDYAYLRYHSECRDLRRYACRSRDSFYLVGWVPEDAVAEIQERMAQFSELSCVIDVAADVDRFTPPTKLKNPFLGRVFQPFLEMYGLPSYHEKDPSLLMAVTYCLFFGIMFGDLGQGLCLALLGLVLTKVKGMWLGSIITCCGLSGALFGCVYGSVFGFEDILPGFKIMEETQLGGLGVVSNVLLLLVLSIALGIFMLLLVMAVNIMNGIKQRNFEKIFFGPNGAAGMVFYAGVLIAALAAVAFGVNLLTPAYVLPVLVLPLALMLFRDPLSHLAAGDPEWRNFSLGEVLGTGVFELFETLLSYLTNTLSFMRIGAYAITHVGLMLVVHMLAQLAGGVGGPVGIVILVAGNAFVMGFEGLLVGIQVLRLEFYELFGRFYDDGGVPFTPKKIDYTSHTD